MIIPQAHYQNQFFAQLSKRYSAARIIEDCVQVLNIQKGAVYKRMNGSTALTTAELVMLARHFKVSLDTVFQEGRFVSFNHPFVVQTDTEDFLQKFAYFLKPLSSMSNSHLTYLANELPVFYYFSNKYIFNFLLSIWNHLHKNDSPLIVEENLEVNTRIEILRKEVTQYYDAHTVTEVWNCNMLANLYQQIVFSITIKAFKEEAYIHHLLEDIGLLISNLKNEVNNIDGSKNRKIYVNDFGNYLNLLLFESDKFQSTFLGYDIPHFLVSYDQTFFDYSKKWLNRIRNRSALISSEGYQSKAQFFIKLDKEYDEFKEKVSKLIAVYYG